MRNRDSNSNNDRYRKKLDFYSGLHVLPKNVSQANSGLIWINALATAAVCYLAQIGAPLRSYIFVAMFCVMGSALAVWREKNVKRSKNGGSSRKDSS